MKERPPALAFEGLSDEEVEWLEEGLGELMEDGYGHENSEGVWEPDKWKALEELSMKMCRANVARREARRKARETQ